MDFELTEEQKLIRKSARDWCQSNLPMERVREMDSKGHPMPKEFFEGLGELGFIMGTAPEEHGGQDLDWVAQSLIAEEIGYADVSMALAAALMALMTGWGFTLDRYCSERVRDEAIRPAIRGEKFIGIAATEPEGGSDVASFKSTAEKDGDEWVLNGEKTFISGTEEVKEWGGGYWVNVRSGPMIEDAPHKNMTSFYLPIDAEGVELVKPYKTSGRSALSTGGLLMDEVRIPDEYRMGEEGRGFYYTMEGFDNARLLIGASAVGVTQRLLEEAMEYIKERKVFGRPLAKYEGIQFELSELYREMEATRLMYLKTAWMQDKRYREGAFKPREVAKWISMCKWKAPHLALEAAEKAMHWLGAAGYTDEYPFEMAWRGVMSYCVGAEGGENIQKIIVGRELLGPEYVPYR